MARPGNDGEADPEKWCRAPYVIIANRIRGTRDGLSAAPGGIPIEERYENSIESGVRARHDLLHRRPDLTAVCCPTDVLASGRSTATRTILPTSVEIRRTTAPPPPGR